MSILLTLLALPSAAPQQTENAQQPAPAVEWQRSLDDALAVQKRTGRPLLVVANQDGETFCEQFAGRVYHDAEFVASTRGWVCVLASTDRHVDRDYDGQGRRIECPRFPGLTCAEHIQIEPQLYERYFDGQRTAPRHIGVDKNGKRLFDRILDRSMQTAIDLIAEHRMPTTDAEQMPDQTRELLTRRDAGARQELERRYVAADREGRLRILQAAGDATCAPFDLLRMALRDDDHAIFAAAANALAATATKDAWIDLADALARADDRLAQTLEQALRRVTKDDAFADRYVKHRDAAMRGIQAISSPPLQGLVGSRTAPTTAQSANEDPDAAVAKAEREDKAAGREDPETALRLASAFLALGDRNALQGSSLTALVYEDAANTAQRGLRHDTDGRFASALQAVLAKACWQLGRKDDACQHGKAALDAALAAPQHVDASTADFAAQLRTTATAFADRCYRRVADDPRAVVSADVEEAAKAGFALSQHPSATSADDVAVANLLSFAGMRQAARRVLEAGVQRAPWDRELHKALRERIFIDRGAEALRAWYRDHLASASDQATAAWYAGFAAIVAAESHVTDKRAQLAEAAYTECLQDYQRSIELVADYADSARHVMVFALAGRGLLRHERGDHEGSVLDLAAAAALRPASMTESDGLGRRPAAILQRVAGELRAAGMSDLAAKLQ
jgi:hypothetical protein